EEGAMHRNVEKTCQAVKNTRRSTTTRLKVVSLLRSGGISGGSAAGPAAPSRSDVVIVASPTATVRVGHLAGLSHRRGPGPRGFLGSGPRLLRGSGPMSR